VRLIATGYGLLVLTSDYDINAILMHGHMIDWSCQKQKTVALSEAEYMAVTHGIKNTLDSCQHEMKYVS